MRGRRGTASIVASPVLVGAVTVLIVVVSVFLAYNANKGLPFVPTYDVSAEIPGAQNLVVGNEVRVGGFRVGVVDKIRARRIEQDGKLRAIAVIDMKLDKIVEPLSQDTRVLTRTRSALGLKYVELTPGRSRRAFQAGDTIPLRQATQAYEFDDLLNTFDQGLRDDSRTALQGFGDALAGRGASVNQALDELPELLDHLGPVMRVLSDPDTGLDQFFVQIGRAARQVAPVADVQAELFTNLADTFEAISRDPEALRATIAKAPPTLQAAIDSFPAQRAFFTDFTDLSRRLRPAVAALDAELPGITDAIDDESQGVLRRSVTLNRLTGDVFEALDDLAKNPNTFLGLRDLRDTVDVGTPLLQYVAPYQTVCNYPVYFFTGLGEHLSERVGGGTIQRILLKNDNRRQDNRLSVSDNDRPADVPSGDDPQDEEATPFGPLEALHGHPYQPAIDARGNADCQNGQNGYLDGPATAPGSKYGPVDFDPNDSQPDPGGGSHVVTAPDFMPSRRVGGTFKARELGIDSLDDVDRSLRRGR